MRGIRLATLGVALSAVAAGAAGPRHHATSPTPRPAPGPPPQAVTGPVADYWMSAATTSGLGAAFAGGRPSMGALFSLATGRGSAPQKSLTLQLASSQPPAGPPQADHFAPPGLGVGPDLPLVTPPPPTAGRPAPVESEPSSPETYQRPKGRLLIFWGCGPHAGPGQPVVFDFSTLGTGAPLPDLGGAIQVRTERAPTYGSTPTYGHWPNERTRVRVPETGSLVGLHTVRGDYTPDIAVQVGPELDFLPPFDLAVAGPGAAGGKRLAWTPMARAGGYALQMIGAQGGGRTDDAPVMVYWSSSAVRPGFFGGGLLDYLPPAEVARLAAQGAVLPPGTGACEIPAEAAQAAPMGLVTAIAYGPEAVFADPPRPPSGPWAIRWRAHVRVKSTATLILGMEGAGRERGRGKADAAPANPADLAGKLLGRWRPF